MDLVDVQLSIQPGETKRIRADQVPQLRHQGLLLGEPVPVTDEDASQDTAAATENPPAGRKPRARRRTATDEGNQA